MESLHDLVHRYVAAWNHPDPTNRQVELTALYARDGRIVTRSEIFAGVDSIVRHVGNVFDQFIAPGRFRFANGGAVTHHDVVLFRWEMRETAGADLADAGMNLFVMAPDGRIADDYQFTLGVDSSIGSDASIGP